MAGDDGPPGLPGVPGEMGARGFPGNRGFAGKKKIIIIIHAENIFNMSMYFHCNVLTSVCL